MNKHDLRTLWRKRRIMHNKIIASIDVFNPNQELLKYGVYAAKQLGARLSLYNAQHRSVSIPEGLLIPGSPGIQLIDQQEKVDQAKVNLRKIYQQISEEWDYTSTQFHTSIVPAWEGDKTLHLIDKVEDQHPTLVMLGVKSNFNIINELLGTPETKLAEQVNCPVLLIPNECVFSEILSINYLLERDKPLVEVMKEVLFIKNLLSVNATDKSINIVYYFGQNIEEAEKDIALKKSIIIREIGNEYLRFHNLANENIDEAIEQNISRHATNLFAFPSRDKSIIERIRSNDNTKRLILKSQIPVLVF